VPVELVVSFTNITAVFSVPLKRLVRLCEQLTYFMNVFLMSLIAHVPKYRANMIKQTPEARISKSLVCNEAGDG